MRLAALFAVLSLAAAAQPADRVLTRAEIEKLEAALARNPADRAAQTQLGRNYAFAILGIVEVGRDSAVAAMDLAKAASPLARHARDVLHSSGNAGLLAESGKALWSLAMRARTFATVHGDWNANYSGEQELAAKTLDRAIELDPESPAWRSYRIPIAGFRSNFALLPLTPADAFAIVKGDVARLSGPLRAYALNDAAKLAVRAGALDDAESYAKEILASEVKDWNYGNAVFFGNMVLGQVALRRGDVPGAMARLLASGKAPGSPQLNSFGPNMTLARDLLANPTPEIREAVLQFFDECKVFWTMHRGRLGQWSDQVRAGAVPDFGANLLY